MINCTEETAALLLADMQESERLTRLCDHQLIAEILETNLPDDLYVMELLARLDPMWSKHWGEREAGH